MHILHVAPVILPVPPATYGGTERVIADLVAAQRVAGHHVTVLAGLDSTIAADRRIGSFHSLAWHEAHGGPQPPGLPATLEAAALADLIAYDMPVDIFHLHGSAHASGVLAGGGTPVFRTVHWRVDEADHQQLFARFPKERIIAISAAQARGVPAASLAGVAHHGLPADRLKAGAGQGGYCAFLGRMTDQKQPDIAIAIARRAGQALRLAGPADPGNPDYFDSRIRPLLGKGAAHVGLVDDRTKQDFLGQARALLFPIAWPEPFGLVMIEAMACGTPVLAFDCGSVREIVEDGVTGAIVADEDEAVARLPEVLALNRARIRRRFEERFTIGHTAACIEALYEAELARS